ncbi:MAG TPA: DUF2892 domain-containing protein [Chitinophagales bacterium]|nr:DUF2892 domain-containing protein [Chitinophagales bacterium]
MQTNMGTLDRVVRLIAAAVVIVLYFMNVVSGAVAIALLVFAGIFILTSIVSFCPLYLPFGISTKQKK